MLGRECVTAALSPCFCLAPSPSPKAHIPLRSRSDPSCPWSGPSLSWVGHTFGGSRDELRVLSLGAAVAPGAHGPLLSRCESAGGHRERPDAAGSKWARQGLQPHQQAAIPADGRPRGPQCPRDNIRYFSCVFTPSFTCSATSPQWFQLRQNLLTGGRGKLPGEMEVVYSGIK